jgi:hypothetical protein
MKRKGMILSGVLVLMACSAAIVGGNVAPIAPPLSTTPYSPNVSMVPAAVNAYNAALGLKEDAQSLLDQAEGMALDVGDIADAIAEADSLLERAEKIMRVHPIAAINMIKEATQLYENAISDLNALF